MDFALLDNLDGKWFGTPDSGLCGQVGLFRLVDEQYEQLQSLGFAELKEDETGSWHVIVQKERFKDLPQFSLRLRRDGDDSWWLSVDGAGRIGLVDNDVASKMSKMPNVTFRDGMTPDLVRIDMASDADWEADKLERRAAALREKARKLRAEVGQEIASDPSF